MGIEFETRTAENTKKYADTARAVGEELGLVVLDLWKVFMERAGWKGEGEGEGKGEGKLLPGAKDGPTNQVLGEFLVDGT